MGYVKHHAIVVTSWNKSDLALAASYAESIGLHVSTIVSAPMNGYGSFLVAPDGSKEGWEESDAGDVRRKTFKEFLAARRYSDGTSCLEWVELAYGNDDGYGAVIHSGWEERE